MKKGKESIQKNVFRMSWTTVFAAIIGLGLSAGIANAICDNDIEFTQEFRLQDCHFKTVGENPYYILQPGYQLVLESDEGRVVITVLPETQAVVLEDGRKVITRVVEERESEDDEVIEISRNFIAICRETGDVYYFGEDVSVCEDGFVEGSDTECDDDGSEPEHPGEWRAGVIPAGGNERAKPGIIMPGTFLLGAKYFEEIAFPVAADRAENVEMGIAVETEAGNFEGCVKVVDTNSVDDVCTVDAEDADEKVYCPGVGLVQDEDLELVEINKHAIKTIKNKK